MISAKERYNNRPLDDIYNRQYITPATAVTPQKKTVTVPAQNTLTPAQSILQKTVAPETTKTAGTQGILGGGKPKVGTAGAGGFYSPELEKLKHSYLTEDYNKMPEFYGDIYGSLKDLTKRVDEPVGTSDRERQAVYNLARRQQEGAVNTAIESMREKLGSVGWKAGESGIADAILSKMAMEGAESLGQKAQEIAITERDRRFQESMELENLNLNRILGAGNLGGLLSNTYLGQKGLGLNALSTAGGLEQFMKQLQQQQRQFGASQGLAREKFQYGKEMDALGLLMNLAGYGQQNQATAWQPYWSALAGL